MHILFKNEENKNEKNVMETAERPGGQIHISVCIDKGNENKSYFLEIYETVGTPDSVLSI